MLPSRTHCALWLIGVCCSVAVCVLAHAQRPALELALTHRSRFASLDPQFRSGFPRSDQALELRTSLLAAAIWPRLQVTAEILDARAELNDSGSPISTGIVNALEPIQLKVNWTLPRAEDGQRSDISVGWLTKDLGSRRLIARNNFRNSVNAFAGVDWIWRGRAGLRLNAFYLHPIRRLPELVDPLYANEQRRDDVSSDTMVAGLHLQSRLADGAMLGEVLLLESDGPDPRVPDTASHDLQTLSLRASRPPDRGVWDYEVETAFQRGTSRPMSSAVVLDHRARFLHLSAGYTFDRPWRPRLVAQYDDASGDDDPGDARTERFDTLYGARSFELGPSGIYGPFVRGNLKTLGLRGTARPSPRWTLMTEIRGFRLASATDAWVDAGLHDPTGASGDDIGRQLESWLNWEALPPRLEFRFGLVYLRYGRFALTAPGATSRTHTAYLYGQLTYRLGATRRPLSASCPAHNWSSSSTCR